MPGSTNLYGYVFKDGLMEGGGSATIEGREGAGWMEVAWPKAYLDHIRTVPQYKQPAGKPQ